MAVVNQRKLRSYHFEYNRPLVLAQKMVDLKKYVHMTWYIHTTVFKLPLC